MPDEHAARAPQEPRAGERAAAAVALAALVAAAGLAIVGIAVHIVAVLVVLVGLLICVTGCWYAVARRGLVRMAAAAVAALALAALIAGLFFAGISLWRLVLLAVLAAGSVLAARVALRRTRKAIRAGAAALVHAARPAHPVLIMNPKSGGGKAERFQLAQECRKRGIEAIVLRPGDDLRGLAQDAVTRGADVLGMAGGDGSQALVASVAARHDIPLVCVPAGTRNHFALDLGLDRRDVVGALDAFADGVEHRIDLGSVNGRTFVNNASLGLYAKIVQAPEYRDAKMKTAAAMLPELLGPDAAVLDLQFTGPAGQAYQTAHLILVSNDPYQLVYPGGRGTRERIDSGMLGIVAVTILDAADARKFLALEAASQVRRFGGWVEWSAPRFEVGSGGPVEIGVDGEALMMNPPVVFETQPGALRVRLPRHALRASPAARTVQLLSGSTVAELGRVVAGRPAVDGAADGAAVSRG